MTLAKVTAGAEGVILRHGLARGAGSLGRLEVRLADAGHVVVSIGYPSRAAGIG